jgi:hypothetical protein
MGCCSVELKMVGMILDSMFNLYLPSNNWKFYNYILSFRVFLLINIIFNFLNIFLVQLFNWFELCSVLKYKVKLCKCSMSFNYLEWKCAQMILLFK